MHDQLDGWSSLISDHTCMHAMARSLSLVYSLSLTFCNKHTQKSTPPHRVWWWWWWWRRNRSSSEPRNSTTVFSRLSFWSTTTTMTLEFSGAVNRVCASKLCQCLCLRITSKILYHIKYASCLCYHSLRFDCVWWWFCSLFSWPLVIEERQKEEEEKTHTHQQQVYYYKHIVTVTVTPTVLYARISLHALCTIYLCVRMYACVDAAVRSVAVSICGAAVHPSNQPSALLAASLVAGWLNDNNCFAPPIRLVSVSTWYGGSSSGAI